jgi:hypothetical protein
LTLQALAPEKSAGLGAGEYGRPFLPGVFRAVGQVFEEQKAVL